MQRIAHLLFAAGMLLACLLTPVSALADDDENFVAELSEHLLSEERIAVITAQVEPYTPDEMAGADAHDEALTRAYYEGLEQFSSEVRGLGSCIPDHPEIVNCNPEHLYHGYGSRAEAIMTYTLDIQEQRLRHRLRWLLGMMEAGQATRETVNGFAASVRDDASHIDYPVWYEIRRDDEIRFQTRRAIGALLEEVSANLHREVSVYDMIQVLRLQRASDERIAELEAEVTRLREENARLIASAGSTNVPQEAATGSSAQIVVEAGETLTGHGDPNTAIIVMSGGRLAPGNSPGILSGSDILLQSDTILEIEIENPSPGIGHDQLRAQGMVQIQGTLELVAPEYTATPGDEIVIIDNDGADPIEGRFHNIADGDRVSLGGRSFRLLYDGGDGNDLTLVQTERLAFISPMLAMSILLVLSLAFALLMLVMFRGARKDLREEKQRSKQRLAQTTQVLSTQQRSDRELTTLTGEFNVVNSENTHLREEINKLKQDLAKRDEQLAKTDASYTHALERVTDRADTAESVNTDLNRKLESLRQELEAVQIQMAVHVSENAELATAFRELERERDALKGRLANRELEIDDIRRQVDEGDTQIATLKQAISGAYNIGTAETIDINIDEEGLPLSPTDADDLREQIKRLQELLDAEREARLTVQDRLDTTTATHEELLRQYHAAQSERVEVLTENKENELVEKISQLERELEEARDSLRVKRADVAEMQARVDQVQRIEFRLDELMMERDRLEEQVLRLLAGIRSALKQTKSSNDDPSSSLAMIFVLLKHLIGETDLDAHTTGKLIAYMDNGQDGNTQPMAAIGSSLAQQHSRSPKNTTQGVPTIRDSDTPVPGQSSSDLASEYTDQPPET